jgi:hypothetical protein
MPNVLVRITSRACSLDALLPAKTTNRRGICQRSTHTHTHTRVSATELLDTTREKHVGTGHSVCEHGRSPSSCLSVSNRNGVFLCPPDSASPSLRTESLIRQLAGQACQIIRGVAPLCAERARSHKGGANYCVITYQLSSAQQ